MAATISGAWKSYIEGLGFSLAAYRDAAPQGAPWPHVVIQEAIAVVRIRGGDQGVGNSVRETVQIDLWERWKNDERQIVEDYDLAADLEAALMQAPLADAPKRVHGVSGVSRVRQVDRTNNTVRNIITVEVDRDQ